MLENIPPEGFLLLHKPADITSYGCIAKLKRLLPRKIKIGHAGTLDPFATGLLIIAIGRGATKHLRGFIGMSKRYLAIGKLGIISDTGDKTGNIVETFEPKHIDREQLEQALTSFGTSYTQTPPMYSALKHKGQPLYKLARTQKLDADELKQITKHKEKVVSIHELVLTGYTQDTFTISTHVSSGTYIRCLVQDIGKKLDTGATTQELERTSIGPFSLENSTHLNNIETIDDITSALISTEEMLANLSDYEHEIKNNNSIR
jgi:tRNA pseudouridine55 synthase